MDTIFWSFSAILGISIALSDQLAINIGSRHGRPSGRIVWGVGVAIPLVVAAFVSLSIMFTGIAIGTVLSGTAYWLTLRRARASREPVDAENETCPRPRLSAFGKPHRERADFKRL